MMTNVPNTAMVYPDLVFDHATAFQRARIVLSAFELGLFTSLQAGPATEAEIRTRLDLHPRSMRDFLDVLVKLGLLEEKQGLYRNSPMASRFLVRGEDCYVGSFLGMVDRVMYPAWGRLTKALRTGAPQSTTFTGNDIFGEWYDDPREKDEMIHWTEEISRPILPVLARTFEWERHASVVEVGTCRGNVLAYLVRAHPHLAACGFDLPQLKPSFDEHMTELGMAGRVRFHGGDFFTDPLPEGDVLLVGHTLVDWSPEDRQRLIGNTFPAVHPGGALVVYDPMIAHDENDLANLLVSLNMQLLTPAGSAYRVEECAEWMRAAGYVEVSHHQLGRHVMLMVGRKAQNSALVSSRACFDR
jgi:O-methyltransferase domain/Dimerisation domain